MKNSISHYLYYLVLPALLLHGAPARHTFAQLRQSREAESAAQLPKREIEQVSRFVALELNKK